MDGADVQKLIALRTEQERIAKELDALHLDVVRELCACANRHHVGNLVASIKYEHECRNADVPSVADIATEGVALLFKAVAAWPPRQGESFGAYIDRLHQFVGALYRAGHKP